MKKLVSLLLMLALLMTAVAQAEVTYPVDTQTKLVLWRVFDSDIVNAGYTSSNDTPAVKNWIERSGIDFEIKEFTDNNALLTAMQADDLPDIIIFDYTTYPGGVMGMVDDGICVELTNDMLQQNAPDYWAYMEENPVYWDYAKQLDGKMYYWMDVSFEANSYYRFWQQLTYREDMLEQYGLKVPTTNEEFYDLLVFARDNIPGITVPFIGDAAHMDTFIEYGYCTSEYGLVAGHEYQQDGVYHIGSYEESYREALRFMNKLYSEKLISVDFASMDQTVAQSSFTNGESLVLFTNNSRLNTLKKAVEEDNGSMVAGGSLHGADQEKSYFAFGDPYVSSRWSAFVTTEAKDPALCLQLLNYLYSEEGRITACFGTEGVTFNYVDGVPTFTEYITNNPNGYALDAMTRTEGLVNWPCIHSNVLQAQRHPEQSQIDSYALQRNSTDLDEYLIVYTGVLPEYSDEYTSLWTDISTYISECRVKFISGQMNLEEDFDNYRANLKSMGIERVIEIKQMTLDALNGK